MADSATEARELIRIVREDTKLPPRARHRAGDLAGLASTNPDLALERLVELHNDTIPDLPMEEPRVDYARAVAVEIFWAFNLRASVKELFVTPEDYLRFLGSAADPIETLWDHLSQQVIAPAPNSWLVPVTRIAGLTGAETKMRLNFAQDPPFVVMVFSVAKMKAAGVEVRPPRGIDAIPNRHIQWYPENVPDERIDSDLPVAALEGIEWRT